MALGNVPWLVHSTIAHTSANGPGTRFALWVQGCTLACSGCFNPETHELVGHATTTGDVFGELLRALPIEGVTVTGGEPLQQPDALADFLGLMRSEPRTSALSAVVLTGYAVAEIRADPRLSASVAFADTVIAGRYNARLHLASGLRGSNNKQYWHLSERYSDTEFAELPDSEILVAPDGTVTLTGMHPLVKATST